MFFFVIGWFQFAFFDQQWGAHSGSRLVVPVKAVTKSKFLSKIVSIGSIGIHSEITILTVFNSHLSIGLTHMKRGSESYELTMQNIKEAVNISIPAAASTPRIRAWLALDRHGNRRRSPAIRVTSGSVFHATSATSGRTTSASGVWERRFLLDTVSGARFLKGVFEQFVPSLFGANSLEFLFEARFLVVGGKVGHDVDADACLVCRCENVFYWYELILIMNGWLHFNVLFEKATSRE